MSESILFQAALKLPPPQRAEFLDAACRGDGQLRLALDGLLKAHEEAGSDFLSPPAEATRDGAPPPVAPSALLGGKYKLVELIGEGGMGEVWLAEQQEPVKRKVAVKLIKPGMDSRLVLARFQAERQALAIMDHPNIAKIFDGGMTPEGRPYFVMEYVKGVPLTEYCDAARLDLAKRLELFMSVCRAVQHAHQKGVLHRDLKPSNVLACLYDGQPVVKVIDFGVAKALHQPLAEDTLVTGHGMVIGTPLYMSPEQAELNNLDVDTRTDIYSLGVLLYELLTGTTPLQKQQLKAAAVNEVLRLVKEFEPPTPSARLTQTAEAPSIAAQRSLDPKRLTRAIAGDLDWIVMKSLEKERSRRYETPAALARDVERFLLEEPIEARPPSFVYLAGKQLKKHRAAILLALAAMVLINVAIGMWIASRVQRESRIASASATLAAALDQASLSLGQAIATTASQSAEWNAAKANRERIADLLATSEVSRQAKSRADSFIKDFDAAQSNRELAEQIEDVLITSATHDDIDSWLRMEKQFEELFIARGFDFKNEKPQALAERIRKDPAAAQLCDALELWIGTKGQLAAMGGPKATAETMQPWADVLLAADPDPFRSGCRKLLYSGKRFTPEQVAKIGKGVDLKGQNARALSWYGALFAAAGDVDRAREVNELALDESPDDFMLNFDTGFAFASNKKWQEAQRYYQRALVLRPNSAGVWRCAGNAYRHTSELSQSKRALERSITLEPTHASTHLDLAQTLRDMKDIPAAIVSAEKALSLSKESSPTHARAKKLIEELKKPASEPAP
jgi:eukaryotic-like serine/threonine-protein kinase